MTLQAQRRPRLPAIVSVFALLCFLAGSQAEAQALPSYETRLAEAEALFNNGESKAATEAFAKLTENFKQKPEPWWYLGILAFQNGDAENAIRAFGQLTNRQPGGGAGWVMLGLSEFRAKRFDSALVHIEQGRFLGGVSNPQIEQLAKVTQAMLCTRIGRFDVALAVLSELAVANVRTPTVVATFGLAALSRATLLDDVPAADQRLVMEAGQVAWLIGARQTEQSIREAEALLQRYPSQPGLHSMLGTALLRNNRERAEKEFRAELSGNPDHFFANVTLASELLEQNRSEDALPFAQRAVSLRPEHLVALTLSGRALLATGNVERAIEHLEKAVALDAENPNARYSLATAYARAGRKDEAARQREIFARMQQKAEPNP